MSKFTVYLLLSCALAMSACTGSRGTIRVSEAGIPASFSPVLEKSGNRYILGKNARKIGDLDIKHTQWGMFYTLASLSDDKHLGKSIGDQTRKLNGDGVVNLVIQAKNCAINGIPVMNFLPFWPGCTTVAITGDIIKAGGP